MRDKSHIDLTRDQGFLSVGNTRHHIYTVSEGKFCWVKTRENYRWRKSDGEINKEQERQIKDTVQKEGKRKWRGRECVCGGGLLDLEFFNVLLLNLEM